MDALQRAGSTGRAYFHTDVRVVGADGRNSTVANLVAARKYNVVPNQRFAYWAFFEGANMPAEPTNVFHRWADKFVIGAAADNGLYQVIVIPELSELPRFRANLERSFMEHAVLVGYGVVIGLATYAAFAASGRIARVLGRTGINVMTRLMGLILAALAVELLADGLIKLFPVLASHLAH